MLALNRPATPARAARYTGAPCPACRNAAAHLIRASFSACDYDAPIAADDGA